MQSSSSLPNIADEHFFTIPQKRIIKAECMRTLKLSGLFILLSFFTLITLSNRHFLIAEFFFLLVMCMLISIPVEFVRIMRNKRRCPFKIYWSDSSISLDDTEVAFSTIKKILLTDANAVSKSIYPKYRYLKIITGQKTYTYWFGSEYGFSYPEYHQLCTHFSKLSGYYGIAFFTSQK